MVQLSQPTGNEYEEAEGVYAISQNIDYSPAVSTACREHDVSFTENAIRNR